jgi:hypothetical protein
MSEKIICPTCGLHFDDEFEETLKPECKLWYALNGDKLEVEDKKKVWDWWFSTPGNYLAHKYNLFLTVSLGRFQNVEAGGEHGNQFAESVGMKRWKKMSEKEQREYQRRYQKWVQNLVNGPGGVWVHLANEFAKIDRITQLVNKVLPKSAKRDSSKITPYPVKSKKKTMSYEQYMDEQKKKKRALNRRNNAADMKRFGD